MRISYLVLVSGKQTLAKNLNKNTKMSTPHIATYSRTSEIFDPLLADAKLAIETIQFVATHPESPAHGVAAADWLEQIARQIREELTKKEVA